MSHPRSCLLLLLGLAAGLVPPARGRPPAADGKPDDPPARADRYGDPLPADAVARLGTVRLRHGNYAADVAFAPDSKTLVSTGGDGSVRLWEVPSGKELRRLEVQGAPGVPQRDLDFVVAPRVAGFANEGKALAVVGIDGSLFVFDPATGKQLQKAQGGRPNEDPEMGQGAATLSPDGKTVAFVKGSRRVSLLETATGKELRQVQVPQGPVTALAFAPDGATLATGDGGTVRLWEVATGKPLAKFRRHEGAVTGLAFSPDGKLLASAGSEDSTVRLWDVAAGKQVGSFSHRHTRLLDSGVNNIHEHDFAATRVAFAPDGKTLVSSGRCDRMVRLWDAKTGQELRAFEGHTAGVSAIALSPDGKMLAAAAEDNSVRLWDVATGKPLGPDGEHRSRLYYMAWGGAGRHLVTGSRDGTVRVWDMATRKPVRQFGTPEDRPFRIAVSADGKLLATGRGDDETVYLWDVATGKEVRRVDTKYPGVETVALSADGKVLATVSGGGAAALWDVPGGKLLREIGRRGRRGGDEEGGSQVVALAPDGQTLAAQTGPNQLTLHDVASGQSRRVELAGQRDGSMFRMVFSPNGKLLAGLEGNSVTVWAVGSGRQVCRIEDQGMHSPEGMMVWESAVFSADGRLLATVGKDRLINLWEASTGKPIRSFKGHQGWGSALAFAPDGRSLASGSLDTTVLVWDLTGLSPDGRLAERELAADELKALWDDLAGADAAKAHRAAWLLAAAPKQVLPYLQQQLKPAGAVDAERLAKLIADLDSDTFEARQQANQELEALGELAAPALRKALAGKPSLEVTRRIEELLQRCDETVVSDAKVRPLRALAVLDWMSTSESRRLLEALAKGAAGDRVTEEAKAALERMKQRE